MSKSGEWALEAKEATGEPCEHCYEAEQQNPGVKREIIEELRRKPINRLKRFLRGLFS